MGGMVLETNMSEILTHIEAQSKLEKSEVRTQPFFSYSYTILKFIFMHEGELFTVPGCKKLPCGKPSKCI